MTDLQTEVLPNLGVWVLNQDSIIARFIRDRRFAVPRCWSKGDSNCRSHPTKSLVYRRIVTDLFATASLVA